MKNVKKGLFAFVLLLMFAFTTLVPSTSVQAACKHSYKVTKTVAATCTSQGYTQKKCRKCGATIKTNIKAKTGHSYKVTKNTSATCTSAGKTVYKCTKCGAGKTTTKPALGHNWQPFNYKTNGKDSNLYVKCSRCGKVAPKNTVGGAC